MPPSWCIQLLLADQHGEEHLVSYMAQHYT